MRWAVLETASRPDMDTQVFGSVNELHSWLEKQQAGYGEHAVSLWEDGGRSIAALRSASKEDLQELGMRKLEASHLHGLLSQGMRYS